MSVSGSTTTDMRFDSIAQLFIPNHITGEVKTIGPIPGQPGRFGIKLNEMPLRHDDPTSFAVPNPSVIITGYTLVSIDPAATEFRPDYFFDVGNPPIFFRTNNVYFHESKNGQQVSVEYWGGGTSLSMQLFSEKKLIDKALAPDVAWSGGTKDQRVMVLKNLTVSDNTTLKCRTLVVLGNMTISSGKTLTILPQTTKTAVRTRDIFEGPAKTGGAGGDLARDFASTGGNSDNGASGSNGTDGLAGYFATEFASGKGGDGGDGGETGSYTFGVGTHTSIKAPGTAGTPGTAAAGLSSSGGSGSGGGSGGGRIGNLVASSASSVAGDGGDSGIGGARITILVFGDFLNFGTINANGGHGVNATNSAAYPGNPTGDRVIGGAGGGGGGGGGAGGALLLAVYGDVAIGTINCKGGDGGDGTAGATYGVDSAMVALIEPGGPGQVVYAEGGDGGGGGDGGDGGIIEIYARTTDFGTLSVAGGAAGAGGAGGAGTGSHGPDGSDGADGTAGVSGSIKTCDIETNPISMLGGQDTDSFAGTLFREIEGLVGLLG